MSRPLRTPEEVERLRERILSEALKVLHEEGYVRMSISRVASRIGMTAANLYNYFAGKDELNLAMQTRISEEMYAAYQEAYKRHNDPLERMRSFMEVQIKMGLKSVNHYDILYSITAPRGTDFEGTKAERIARAEKKKAHQIALRIRAIHMKVAMEISEAYASFQPDEATYLTNRMWCMIHGAITLHNRSFLERFGESDEKMFSKICEDALAPFLPVSKT